MINYVIFTVVEKVPPSPPLVQLIFNSYFLSLSKNNIENRSLKRNDAVVISTPPVYPAIGVQLETLTEQHVEIEYVFI